MKFPGLRPAVSSATFFALTCGLAAHPGHEGEHDVTWDFGHLAAHPLATVVCFAVLAAAVGLVVLAVRWRSGAPAQSFRGSQPSRGK